MTPILPLTDERILELRHAIHVAIVAHDAHRRLRGEGPDLNCGVAITASPAAYALHAVTMTESMTLTAALARPLSQSAVWLWGTTLMAVDVPDLDLDGSDPVEALEATLIVRAPPAAAHAQGVYHTAIPIIVDASYTRTTPMVLLASKRPNGWPL